MSSCISSRVSLLALWGACSQFLITFINATDTIIAGSNPSILNPDRIQLISTLLNTFCNQVINICSNTQWQFLLFTQQSIDLARKIRIRINTCSSAQQRKSIQLKSQKHLVLSRHHRVKVHDYLHHVFTFGSCLFYSKNSGIQDFPRG